METLGSRRVKSLESDGSLRDFTNEEIRSGPFSNVRSFLDLSRSVAALQFNNPHLVLLFRGQSADYQNAMHESSLKPTLFRPERNQTRVASPSLLHERFSALREAERLLLDRYVASGMKGKTRLARQRLVRWAILQHYEVCRTPLLDVTHSLRIAASFATHAATESAFLYVLGVPAISGAITANADAGLQVLRLSSICPPEALRAHLQEGYLIGEYPEMQDFDQKRNYAHYEVDVGRRLVAKFCFDSKVFWKDPLFPQIPTAALYPPEGDPLLAITASIKRELWGAGRGFSLVVSALIN